LTKYRKQPNFTKSFGSIQSWSNFTWGQIGCSAISDWWWSELQISQSHQCLIYL